jgi:hypothetical protein
MIVVWEIVLTNNSSDGDEEQETWLTEKKGKLFSFGYTGILVPLLRRVNKPSGV